MGVAGYEILEHTADVGVRARGTTLEDVFEQATRGLTDIVGIWRPGKGTRQDISLESDDVGALLVDWLSDVVFFHDSQGAAITEVHVERAGCNEVEGWISLTPLEEDEEVEGTQIKAVTYHQLKVERSGEGWVAEVYFDV